MNDRLKQQIKGIALALDKVSEKTSMLCDGNIEENVSTFKRELFIIKDVFIPGAIELCPEGEYEPKHILEKIERNIWAMDYTILSRIGIIKKLPEDKSVFLKQWIKRYSSDLKQVLEKL